MKTVTIKVKCNFGLVGSDHRGEISVEVDDNATEEQIEEACNQMAYAWACEFVDYRFEIINE